MSILCTLFAFALSDCQVPLTADAVFEKRCAACHSVVTPEGATLAGRGAKTGPNLYGVPGNSVGAAYGFRYSTSFGRLVEQGVVWGPDNFAAFLQAPNEYLRDALDDPTARSKMGYRLKQSEEAQIIYDYLSDLSAN